MQTGLYVPLSWGQNVEWDIDPSPFGTLGVLGQYLPSCMCSYTVLEAAILYNHLQSHILDCWACKHGLPRGSHVFEGKGFRVSV